MIKVVALEFKFSVQKPGIDDITGAINEFLLCRNLFAKQIHFTPGDLFICVDIDLEQSKFCDYSDLVRTLEDTYVPEKSFTPLDTPFEKPSALDWDINRAKLILNPGTGFVEAEMFHRASGVPCGFCCGKPRMECGVCFDVPAYNAHVCRNKQNKK